MLKAMAVSSRSEVKLMLNVARTRWISITLRYATRPSHLKSVLTLY